MDNDFSLRKYAGSVIKNLREKKNITQDELAEELKLTRQAVSRYENGDRGVNQHLLYRLSEIFQVPISKFFPENYDSDFEQNDERSKVLDEFEVLYSKNKDKLTESDREYMRMIIEKRMNEIDEELERR